MVRPRPLLQILGEELQRGTVAALHLDAGPARPVHEEVVRRPLEEVVGTRDGFDGGEHVERRLGRSSNNNLRSAVLGVSVRGVWVGGFDDACCPGLGVYGYIGPVVLGWGLCICGRRRIWGIRA